MPNTSAFNTKLHHIRLLMFVHAADGTRYKLRAILDTGAVFTEISDQFLQYSGIAPVSKQDVNLKAGLQTQKYNKVILPTVEICGHTLPDMTVYVSRFERSWGVDALIGLDFFRRFRVTVDYRAGHIITEPYE